MSENQQPNYTVIEDEEESITIDFKNKSIYQKEEELVVIEKDEVLDDQLAPEATSNSVASEGTITINSDGIKIGTTAPPKPSFQDELQDLLLNSVTSKAIAALLSKHYSLDTDLDKTLSNRRMGQLNEMITSEVQRTMDKHRQELRACYVGDKVRYENIPDWAKAYVKEYIKDMISGLAILVDDGE